MPCLGFNDHFPPKNVFFIQVGQNAALPFAKSLKIMLNTTKEEKRKKKGRYSIKRERNRIRKRK